MGVDFYACDCCGESRYEEYVDYCYECSHRLCTNCLVNDDLNESYAYRYGTKFDGSKEQMEEFGLEEGWYEIGDIIDDTGIDSKYCPFCNGERVHDEDLLDYLLDKCDLTKEEAKAEYLDYLKHYKNKEA